MAAVRTHALHSVQTALKMEGYCCPSFSKKSAKSFVKKICPKKRKLSSDLEVIGNDQNNENWPPEGRPTKVSTLGQMSLLQDISKSQQILPRLTESREGLGL